MVFSSLLFLFRFLPAVLILYYIAPRKLRNVILLLFSLFFYAWGEPKYVFLMLFTITMDFFIGKGIDKAKKEGNQKKAKRFLMTSILVDLSILGFFKYADFLIGTVNTLTGAGIPLLGIPLPIGISFFTFQTMSYTIDVYKGSTEVQKNWIKYGTYVSMFPQLIAGPIVQYKTIAEQMEHRKENTSDFSEGIHRFMIGLGKKVLIANNIGALWDAIAVLPVDGLAAGTAWLGALAYTFQIYFDFSGYSDMAIGLGKMMGFHFPENFNYPYMSHSVAEFWRRWHITLGDWFKSYIYFPMGGSRKGLPRTIINLLVVWTITGIWHGASWNFMLWGTYFGILIVIERLFLGKVLEKIPSFFSWLYTFIMVVFGWVMFDAVAPGTVSFGNVFEQIWTFISAMFGGNGVFIDDTATNYIVNYGIIFAVCIFGSSDVLKTIADYIRKKAPTWVQYGFPVVDTVIMLASVAYLSTSNYNPFLYFNF